MSLMKLAVLDGEDLQVVSAHVQDSVLKIGDLSFDKRAKLFSLNLRRFAWERADEKRKGQPQERRLSVLHFNRVEKVQTNNLRMDDKEGVLNLLSVSFEETEAPAGTIELVFSGGGAARLHVECLEAQLSDLGGAWATDNKPQHDA